MKIRYILLLFGLTLAINNICQTQASLNRCDKTIAELHTAYEWLQNNGATVND